MSSFNLAKKLHPAKKAWKSFTKTLQSKLQKLKISKTVKKTTRRLKSLRSTGPLIPRKLRALTRRCSHRDYHRHRHLHHQLEKNMAAIYVDELFAGPVSSHAKQIHPNQETSSRRGENKAKVEGKTMTNVEIIDEKVLSRKSKASESSSTSAAAADAGKLAAVSSLPQLQGIDERAEEFISKFREDIKLQREQSILDFQEMLARSA